MLASLKTLDLSHNALASLSGHLGQCSSLTALSLADNLLEEMPACVEHLRQVASLFLAVLVQKRQVQFTCFTGTTCSRRCPRASGTCGQVASLFLRYWSKSTDTDVRGCGVGQLVKLDVLGNPFAGQQVPSLLLENQVN